MRRHRTGAPPPRSESSSSSSDDDDDDGFSAFTSRSKKAKKKKQQGKTTTKTTTTTTTTTTSGKHQSTDASSSSATKTPKSSGNNNNSNNNTNNNNNNSSSSSSSSSKRHHGASTARQARMDALLLELEGSAADAAARRRREQQQQQQQRPASSSSSSFSDRPPPDKRGSFVDPGQEHLTTNIFVGNLAPSVTEEALTDLFRQFGDLYSVKIMWPRTAEERSRNRNTGFVCFMTRDDAQEAMDAYNDADVFGRRMVLRWGKNVKKTVKRGTGGVPIPPIKKRDRGGDSSSATTTTTTSARDSRSGDDRDREGDSRRDDDRGDGDLPANHHDKARKATSSLTPIVPPYPVYDPALHEAVAVKVVFPRDLYRTRLITTVASFVAKDGSVLERRLRERESSNPLFSFLDDDAVADRDDLLRDRVFYRWRVFAFAQGDGFDSWRTAPFLMFDAPAGRWWIPPPIPDRAAALAEEETARRREEDILRKMEERRRVSADVVANRDAFSTGRQLEHARFGGGNVRADAAGGGGRTVLNAYEEETLNDLLENLTASRRAVRETMAFCFEKSGAAAQIADVLRERLLEDDESVETRIARLYLLSDVLFNSQQPGVRNAFRYRDAVEAMAPEVFESMGRHGKGAAGRMTMNKLRLAVRAVLNAWTSWSVYNAAFIDELTAKFEGRELRPAAADVAKRQEEEEKKEKDRAEQEDADADEETTTDDAAPPDVSVVVTRPLGGWKEADDDDAPVHDDDVDGERLKDGDVAMENGDPETGAAEPTVEPGEHDGEPLDENDEFDGEPFSALSLLDDADADAPPANDDDANLDETKEETSTTKDEASPNKEETSTKKKETSPNKEETSPNKEETSTKKKEGDENVAAS